MKRFLSITLCVMMLVSVFSIGASATVPTSYTNTISPAVPKVDYIPLQDFSNVAEEDAALYTGDYGNGTATIEAEADGSTNNVLKLVAPASGAAAVPFDTSVKSTALTADDTKLTIEFKVKPSVNTETLTVAVRMPYLRNLVDTKFTDKAGQSVGYAIYGSTFKANEWNTVKVAIDIPASYAFGTNSAYPEASNAGSRNSATITVNGTNVSNKRSGVSTATANQYHVSTQIFGSGTYKTVDPLVAVGVARSNPATSGANTYLFDDINVYKPEVAATTEKVNYSVYEGDVIYTNASTFTIDAAALGFNNSANKRAQNLSYTKDAGEAAIITFDAKNTTAGFPLCFQISNGTKTFKVNIFPSATIGSDWYSYKIVTNSGDSTGFDSFEIFRKKTGTADAYRELGWTTEYLSHGSSGSGHAKYIQIGYWINGTINQYYPSTAETAAQAVWEVKELQMVKAVNGGAVTGEAKAKGDGTADVKLFYATKPGATTPIVAVYDGTTLVDIEYAAATQSEGEFTANVDYAAGNTVKLFIWDGIATGVPVLNAAVPITVQ